MCDFDYERLFRQNQENDTDFLRIAEDLRRQLIGMDDDDEEVAKVALTSPTAEASRLPSSLSSPPLPPALAMPAPGEAAEAPLPPPPPQPAINPVTSIVRNNAVSNVPADAMIRQGTKETKTAASQSHNSFPPSRVTEPLEMHSFSSSHSRGQPQLTSSGPQTPTKTPQEDNSPRTTGVPAPYVPSGDVNAQKSSSSIPQEKGIKPLPPYSQQEECPPPYGWVNNVQAKHLNGGAPQIPLHSQVSPTPIPHAMPPLQHPSQMPYAVYAPNAFAPCVPARSMMLQQPQQLQGSNTTVLQALGLGQIPTALQPPLPPPPPPPPHPLQTSIPHQLQQHQQQQLQQQQQQQQQQQVAGVIPPGYVQVLVPVRTADGSTGYQLMMMPSQQIGQGAKGLGTPAGHPTPQEPLQAQQQAQQQYQHGMTQYVWQQQQQQPQPPQATQQQEQPQPQQQSSQPQQFVTPEYANIAAAPQRYAIVTSGGQQQYVMAMTLNQLQQAQQQQIQQQIQQQQSQVVRPVYLTSHQPQQMFATSMVPSGMPPGYRFN